MQHLLAFVALITLAAGTQAQTAHHNGDHPAVVVQRLQAQAGYDYQSKFYPHPAWLYLSAEAPHPMMDHPAVIIAKREQEQRQAAQAAIDCDAQRYARK
jgi:hypothetical protein